MATHRAAARGAHGALRKPHPAPRKGPVSLRPPPPPPRPPPRRAGRPRDRDGVDGRDRETIFQENSRGT